MKSKGRVRAHANADLFDILFESDPADKLHGHGKEKQVLDERISF